MADDAAPVGGGGPGGREQHGEADHEEELVSWCRGRLPPLVLVARCLLASALLAARCLLALPLQ